MWPPPNGRAATAAPSPPPPSSSPSSRRFALVAAMSCLVAVVLLLLFSSSVLDGTDRPPVLPSPLSLALLSQSADPSSPLSPVVAAASDAAFPSASPAIVRLRAELSVRQRRRMAAAEAADEASIAVCQAMVTELEIVIGSSWGKASEADKGDWWLRDCDAVLGLTEYRQHLAAQPLAPVQPIAIPPDRQSPGPRSTAFEVVAICVSTTTRYLDIQRLDQLTLFTQLLPSIVEKADVGYEYWLYLLYDVGDPFLDQDSSRSAIQQWFDDKFVAPLQARDIASRLVLCRYANALNKPGPAFNYLTHLAFIDGVDWIYRINDDSQFMTPFAFAMATALTAMGPPYGVVGPVCNEGAQGILTHDFTHRTHHLIMPYHYPPPLVDWWMDDWITRVYGQQRTKRVTSVVVQHLVKSHGTRYTVNLQHKLLLGTEVENGRQLIELYMADQAMLKELNAFENDTFKFYV